MEPKLFVDKYMSYAKKAEAKTEDLILKKMKKVLNLIKWILIALLASVLLIVVTIIAFPTGIFLAFWKRQIGTGLDEIATYFKKIAISIDQLGNVSGFSRIDFLFKTQEGYAFGNEDETISYVLKVNQEHNTLRRLGKPLYNIINFIDKGHFDNLTD